MEKDQMNALIEMAKKVGFSYAVPLDVSTMVLMDEVRAMCADNTCGRYGKSWVCPPGCGELSECRERVAKYRVGILVQTVGEVEDSLDFEGMMEVEHGHKEHFSVFSEILRKQYPKMLPLGTGSCRICKTCTYPDAPCRFPEKKVSSLESYGVLVTDICTKNGMKYYYGSDHIAYTACYLLE